MRRAVAVLLLWTVPALAAEPRLARVTLSSGGVGQFEFGAQVDGGAALTLDVPLDQVDDVLKSLRVDDPAGLPSLRLPGRQPLAESFRTLPFQPDAFASAPALLSALVGERVRLPGPGVEGTILSVSPFDAALPNGGGTVTRHRLTVATATGIEQVVLEDTPGVEFASPALRGQIAAGLAAIAAQRVQDRRTMTLGLAPGGARTVRFGYVVPAPVWKASYRITVPPEGTDGPARLQGYAVVENLSGRDWTEAEVVLTSGQPVLFHTPLYEAVFTARPEAPVEVPNRLVPQLDQGALPKPDSAAEDAGPDRRRAGRAVAPMAAMMAPAPAPAPPAGEPPPPPPPPPSEVRQSVALVEYRLAQKVTAASGESLMLPIADRPIPAKRVALYQPATDPLHPLVGLLLANDTQGALPPGLATLYERRADGTEGFVGDARLPAIQPGEDRIASFAADLAVTMQVTRDTEMLLTDGRVAGGVLTLTRQRRQVITYRAAMPAGSGRTLLIEQPRPQGWTLAEPADAGVTPTAWRITRAIPAGAVESIRVVLEQPVSERISLVGADVTRLLALAEQGRLTPELRGALGRAAALRAELDRRQAALRELRDRRAELARDQDRVRSNLGAVPANSELQRRYLAQMQQQETELASLATQADAAQRAVTEADTALKAFIQAL
jgi:hypothetical protein